MHTVLTASATCFKFPSERRRKTFGVYIPRDQQNTHLEHKRKQSSRFSVGDEEEEAEEEKSG